MSPRTVAVLLVASGFSLGVPRAGAQDCANYAIDPRVEPYALSDPSLLPVAEASALVVARSTLHLQAEDPPTYRMDVQPWTVIIPGGPGCSDRDYHGQPDPSANSGVLVGEDLVLTAGHVIVSNGACQANISVVFGFGNFSPNQWQVTCSPSSDNCWVTVPAEDVYNCIGAVVAGQPGGPADDDWAVVTLDRDVTGRSPLPIRRAVNDPPPVLTPMWIVGHPNSVPIKMDAGTSDGAYNVDGVHILLNNSGSMAVSIAEASDAWEVVGIAVSGFIDVQVACDPPAGEAGCYRENFSNTNTSAILTPAYRAGAYIP